MLYIFVAILLVKYDIGLIVKNAKIWNFQIVDKLPDMSFLTHNISSLVWSVALYGCESWTLRKEDERKLTSFEMWLWRRVLRISWIERKSNSWVREKVKITEDNGMLAHVKHRKISKYCHWKRRPSSLVLTTIEGKTPGKGKRGRRRYKWLDILTSERDGSWPRWTGRMAQFMLLVILLSLVILLFDGFFFCLVFFVCFFGSVFNGPEKAYITSVKRRLTERRWRSETGL